MEVYEDPGEELDDVQWLEAQYKLALKREMDLLEFLFWKLANYDARMGAIEDKLGLG